MNIKSNPFVYISAAVLVAASAQLASAQSLGANLGVNAGAQVGSSSVGVGVNVTARMKLAITRADQEIQRRSDALAALSARVNAMVKLSDSQKAAIATSIQSQISALAALKTKVDADTDAATLRADVQSITKSYRIFALVIPQGAILAASDRAMTLADSMDTLAAKLQARISAAAAAGADVSAMQTAYADFTSKTADAKVQAAAAVSGTANLTPDNGDQAAMQANHQALVAARANIKTASQDIAAARRDAGVIVKALKSLNVSAGASASSSAGAGASQ